MLRIFPTKASRRAGQVIIAAHGLPELFNVQVPTIAQANNAGQLDADVGAGLYLLIFERDRFGVTLTPQSTPATVTYDLTIE